MKLDSTAGPPYLSRSFIPVKFVPISLAFLFQTRAFAFFHSKMHRLSSKATWPGFEYNTEEFTGLFLFPLLVVDLNRLHVTQCSTNVFRERSRSCLLSALSVLPSVSGTRSGIGGIGSERSRSATGSRCKSRDTVESLIVSFFSFSKCCVFLLGADGWSPRV